MLHPFHQVLVLQLKDRIVERENFRAYLVLDADDGQAVRPEQLRQDLLAAALVHVRGGLVQEDDSLILDQHAGERQLLLFAAGKVALRVLERLVKVV